MRILGIHGGHNATACLFEDGRIVAEVSEERFSRRKNHSGFPALAVRWLLEAHGISGSTLDRVAVGGLVTTMVEDSWRDGVWERVTYRAGRLLPARLTSSEALVRPYLMLRGLFGRVRRQVADHLRDYDVPIDKIELVEHHTSHAHAAYWLDFNRRSQSDTLVVTLDNTGDGFCGSVHIAGPTGDLRLLKRLQALKSLGMVYTAITCHLGMRPVEDEYKVMGLAPYARGRRADRVYEILRGHLDLTEDDLDFVNRTGLGQGSYIRRFREELAGYRFDDIAAGAQRLVEELVTRYVRAWARKTGIRKLVVGGGVFMNVKLNMLLAEQGELDEVFFLPSCGDEHNAAGAALKCALDLSRAAGEPFNPKPLGPLYMGPEYDDRRVESALVQAKGNLQWARVPDVERETARLLASGRIIGRLAGRMEFGARALGNRSILARADSLNTVQKINAAIKMRDFWMPFAPAILWERGHDYVVNPGKLRAPYMILGFQSTPLARRELIAGLHPFDLSCRPQLVEREWNPKFHRLLTYFQELTGCGGLLNTSFNLHGDPVVCSPEDAIQTYLQSDLDVLTLESFVVWDRRRAERVLVEAGASATGEGSAFAGWRA